MKNRVKAILLVVLLFCIIIFYQNKLQYDSEERIRGEILSEWEERKKIEDSIKSEIDSKKSSQEFIIKLDYQRQLEDMLGSKFAELETGILAFRSDLESLVNSRLSEYEKQNFSSNQESEARIKKLHEYLAQQDERRDGLESSFMQRLKSSEDSQEKLTAQVENLKQEIEKLLKKQAEFEKRINEYSIGQEKYT
ncbi:MAG: hypothetical protein FJZ15_01590 [Candidatus Omnitrophica bacterium]|nr:hypothetical protein [Candidatus Omnitrophota bacterium]